MKIDDNRRRAPDRRFDVFCDFVPDDLIHVPVERTRRHRSEDFGFELVLPAVVGTDTQDVNGEGTDEGVPAVEEAGNDDNALMREVFLFLDDRLVDAVRAFSDDIAP